MYLYIFNICSPLPQLVLCPWFWEFVSTFIMIVDLRVVFLIRLRTDVNFSLRMAFTEIFIAMLCDHFTNCQLGKDNLVWEAACHSDTAAIPD